MKIKRYKEEYSKEVSFHDTNKMNRRSYDELNEKHINEIILYDEDGSKLVLSGDALNMIPCKSTNTNDLMKELFGDY